MNNPVVTPEATDEERARAITAAVRILLHIDDRATLRNRCMHYVRVSVDADSHICALCFQDFEWGLGAGIKVEGPQ